MSGGDEAEGFLARWSRRKRGAAEEAPAAAPATPEATSEAAPTAAEAPPACPIPSVPAIDPASLPSIEELTAESDLVPFLRPGVPPLLRQAALRRIWSLDVSIRDYIGPVEYQWDFNTPGGLPHGFANELVGEVRKLLAQAIGQRDEEEPEAAAPEPTPPDSAETPAPGPEIEMADAEAPDALPSPPEDSPLAQAVAEPPPPPRRRHGGALPA